MTYLTFGIIGLGGFLGAIVRYLISQKMNKVTRIPLGTLAVNLVGALLIGVVFGMELSPVLTFFFAAGFAGALTTFSTLNRELIDLWQVRKKKESVLYLLVTYCGGIICTSLGYLLVS